MSIDLDTPTGIITIFQVYAPDRCYSDSGVDNFYGKKRTRHYALHYTRLSMNNSMMSLNSTIEQVKSGIRSLRQTKSEGRLRESDIAVKHTEAIARIKELENLVQEARQNEITKKQESLINSLELKKVREDNSNISHQLQLLQKDYQMSQEKVRSLQTNIDGRDKKNMEMLDEIKLLHQKINNADASHHECKERLRIKENEIVSYVRDRRQTKTQLQSYIEVITKKWQASVACCETLAEKLQQEIERRRPLKDYANSLKQEHLVMTTELKAARDLLKQRKGEKTALAGKEKEIIELNQVSKATREEMQRLQREYDLVRTELERSLNIIETFKEERAETVDMIDELRCLVKDAEKHRDQYQTESQAYSANVVNLQNRIKEMESQTQKDEESRKKTCDLLRVTVVKLEKEIEQLRKELMAKEREIGKLKQEQLNRDLQAVEFHRAEMQRSTATKMKQDLEESLLDQNRELHGKVALLQIYKNLGNSQGVSRLHFENGW